jgi:hypothetical protein
MAQRDIDGRSVLPQKLFKRPAEAVSKNITKQRRIDKSERQPIVDDQLQHA